MIPVLINQVTVRCEDATEDVEIVDVDKFNQMIEDESVFVMFYAPWCGHCQRLKPTWDQLMKDINADNTIPITIMKVSSNFINWYKLKLFLQFLFLIVVCIFINLPKANFSNKTCNLHIIKTKFAE